MLKMYDFNTCPANDIRYGGHAGSKKGILLFNENWFLKFPQTTKDFRGKMELSYTTSPISEYVGSNIYKLIGIPTHETLLGVCDNKIVVACKDFRHLPEERFDDYNSIKNDYVTGLDDKLKETSSSSTHMVNLDEVIIVMDNNPLFVSMPELKERFWNMFIVDALISNNDRNNGNWGVIVNIFTKQTRIAPVFDNGSSFNNKTSDAQMLKILNDDERFYSSVYASRKCIFSQNDVSVNPLKYIENVSNRDCNEALLRVVPNINPEKIRSFIFSIPGDYNGLKVMSEIQKEFYSRCVEYRYQKVLLPAYQKALALQKCSHKLHKQKPINDQPCL